MYVPLDERKPLVRHGLRIELVRCLDDRHSHLRRSAPRSTGEKVGHVVIGIRVARQRTVVSGVARYAVNGDDPRPVKARQLTVAWFCWVPQDRIRED